MSDHKLGPLNTVIVMNMLTLLAVLAIWLPFGASTVQALYAVVVLMGIGTGSFVPLGGNKLVLLPMTRFIVCSLADTDF